MGRVYSAVALLIFALVQQCLGGTTSAASSGPTHLSACEAAQREATQRCESKKASKLNDCNCEKKSENEWECLAAVECEQKSSGSTTEADAASRLSELLHEPWTTHCAFSVPSSWAFEADEMNPGPVLFRPRVGSGFFDFHFTLSVEILLRKLFKPEGEAHSVSTMQDAPLRETNGPTFFSPFKAMCYENEVGAENPVPARAFSTPTVATMLHMEDGTEAGTCAMARGNGNSLTLDWDSEDLEFYEDRVMPFVRFECTADQSMSMAEFDKVCTVLMERSTNAQGGAGFASCWTDTRSAFRIGTNRYDQPDPSIPGPTAPTRPQ